GADAGELFELGFTVGGEQDAVRCRGGGGDHKVAGAGCLEVVGESLVGGVVSQRGLEPLGGRAPFRGEPADGHAASPPRIPASGSGFESPGGARNSGSWARRLVLNFGGGMSAGSPSLMTWPLLAIPRWRTGRGVICSGICPPRSRRITSRSWTCSRRRC